MPDRIPELDRLAAEAKEIPMLPATEIRRMGDRRRTVRRSGIAAVVVVIATALGFGVWASPLMDGTRGPQWANPTPTPTAVATDDATPTADPSPTVVVTETSSPEPAPVETPTTVESPTVEPTEAETPDPEVTGGGTTPAAEANQPTWDNVPTLEMMYPYDPTIAEVSSEYEGMGQAAKGLCDPGEWGDPTTILVREFTAVDGEVSTAIVLGYESDEAAAAGYALIESAARNCPTAMNDPYFASFDATTSWSAYATSMHPYAEDDDYRWFNETHLVYSGNRVLWQVRNFAGQDHNCGVEPGNEAGQCDWVMSSDEVTQRLNG